MATATKIPKLSIAELSALYDRIYNIADRLIKKYNPCNIHTKNKRLCCTSHPEGHITRLKRLCCNNCWWAEVDHYSLFGCATKCLLCKLYLCEEAGEENKLLSYRLHKLKSFALKHLYLHYFQSKEQWLKQMGGYNE